MKMTITLENLLRTFPLPCNGKVFNRDKIRNLLPEDISNKLLLVKGNDCSPAQLTNVWQSNSKAQSTIFNNVFDHLNQSTTFNDYCKEILEKWQTVENLDAREFRLKLKKILSDDEDKNEMSVRLFNWFKAVFLFENLELLRYALTAMTVLAVTRGNWLIISARLIQFLPHVSTLPGQPDKANEKAFNACKEAYDEACKETRNNLALLNTEQHLQTVEDNLKNVFNAKKPRWNAYVAEALGELWFKIANKQFSANGCNRIAKHRIWLSKNGIIESSQDNTSVAINFFKRSQNSLSDEALHEDWCKVSDKLLDHLIGLLEKGASLPKDFNKTANAPKDHKEWYGKATFRLAKFYFDNSDIKKFIKWLKRSVTLKNVNAMNLAMKLSCFNDATKDTTKKWTQAFDLTEEEKKALDACPNDWNEKFAIYLAKVLKDADNPTIKGAARYLLYLDRGDKQDLRSAWNCGYPKAAVLEYEKTIVSFVEELSHADSKGTHGTCVLNVGRDNSLAKIFAATMPEEGWEILYDSITIPSTNEHQIFLLIDEDKEKNLSDFLHLLSALKKSLSPANSTKICIRCSSDKHTIIIDTALNRFPDRLRSCLSVRIIDDLAYSVRNLFSNECPLFVPLLNRPNANLHLVVVGNNPMALQIVRDSSWFMTFDKSISTKITMLTPFGTSLKDEILTLCPEIICSTTIEEKHILMPGFPSPDGLKHPDTLQSVIDKFVETSNDALYFAVTAFQSSTENLNIAILVREAYLRAWIKSALEGERPPKVPVAYFCPDDDFALLSKYAIVYAQDYGGDWFNHFSLTPFGSQLRYSWSQLVGDGELATIERIAVQVHMIYCGLTNENFDENICESCYRDYAKWTYNAQSSIAVALSLPYRIFLLERLSGKKLFDRENKNFFAKENLQQLAKHFETDGDDKLKNYLPLLFEWEHRRWISYQRANSWRLATIRDAKIFLKGGNIRQNLWIARLHACLVEWEALPKMAEELMKYELKTKDGHQKDFQALDKAIILATKDLLSESILKQSSSLQRIFFAHNE